MGTNNIALRLPPSWGDFVRTKNAAFVAAYDKGFSLNLNSLDSERPFGDDGPVLNTPHALPGLLEYQGAVSSMMANNQPTFLVFRNVMLVAGVIGKLIQMQLDKQVGDVTEFFDLLKTLKEKLEANRAILMRYTNYLLSHRTEAKPVVAESMVAMPAEELERESDVRALHVAGNYLDAAVTLVNNLQGQLRTASNAVVEDRESALG